MGAERVTPRTESLEGRLVEWAIRPTDPPELRPTLREHARRCLDLFQALADVERVRRS